MVVYLKSPILVDSLYPVRVLGLDLFSPWPGEDRWDGGGCGVGQCI